MTAEGACCIVVDVTGPFGLLDAERAEMLADTLHLGQRETGGAPLIDHVRRVASAVPRHARVVAWLHELFEHTPTSEQALLEAGISAGELRALRLLTRGETRSNERYLGHVRMIARASGPGADIARIVKRADLADRALHPRIRADGWTPPYDLARGILERQGLDQATTAAYGHQSQLTWASDDL